MQSMFGDSLRCIYMSQNCNIRWGLLSLTVYSYNSKSKGMTFCVGAAVTKAKLRHLCHHHLRLQIRTFVNAKVKWVRDPYLDKAVEKEKNLKPLLAAKNLILSQPSNTISLSAIAKLKPHLQLPTAAIKFFQKYCLIFKIFQPPPKKKMPPSQPHVKLGQRAISLHIDETLLFGMAHYKVDVAERLAKLLMLTGAKRLPFYVIDKFRFDIGLPYDYRLSFLPQFPDYFSMCEMEFNDFDGCKAFGLELVTWKKELAISKVAATLGKTVHIKFSMNFPNGFDLQKKVKEWVDEFQNLPYISPYENAFHLAPNSDQAEKYTVSVIHELLCLMVSKKTECENVYNLGEYLGFGKRFKKALVHFPGIFYLSNKIRTQTVVLREAYSKNSLIEKHPVVSMRFRYITLMNTVLRRGRPIRGNRGRVKKKPTTTAAKMKKRIRREEWKKKRDFEKGPNDHDLHYEDQ